MPGRYISKYLDSSNIPIPWKTWLNFAAKHNLYLKGWRNHVISPGPDFMLKKIPANDLRDMVRDYVDGNLTSNTTFTVEKWSAGAFYYYYYFLISIC